MSEKLNAERPRRSLRDIFKQIDAADNPELGFINLVLDGASQKDSELPELLRACAIPRRFDEQIIGVLRSKPDDLARNRQLLHMVCAHKFVLKRGDGAYVYHDNTRDALLEDWHAEAQRHQLFIDLNEKLAAFYEAEHDIAVQAEQDLTQMAPVMRRANIARYRQLSSRIEKRLIAPLIEALYHRFLASPADGFSFFRDQFHLQEEGGHYITCQSLIDAVRDFLHRLPLGQQNQRQFNWLDYFEVRILRQLPPYEFEKAESKLNALLQSEEGEPQFRLWALNDLSMVLEAQLKSRETLRARIELAALAEATNRDVYNLPIYYSNLGNLHWQLSELDLAGKNYSVAIEKSESRHGARPDTQVLARLDLSGVYGEAGQWDRAWESAVEALYLARVRFARDQLMQRSVAHRFMALLATYDPRASDSVAHEYYALVQSAEEPLGQLHALDRYISVLHDSGRITCAETQLRRLQEATGKSEYKQQFAHTLLFSEASSHEERGRYDDAIACYTRILGQREGQQVDKWTLTAARSNRGIRFVDQASWQAAEEDLRVSLQSWESYGYVVIAAYIRVELADMLRRRGLMVDAQRELDAAARILTEGTKSYLTQYYLTQGAVYLDQSNWIEAQQCFEKALEVSSSRRQMKLQATALRSLAQVASSQANWSLAAACDAQSAQVNEYRAGLDAYLPSAAEPTANEKNVNGLREFCAGASREQALDHARALFRSAINDVPGNFWYQLNLSFTCAELEEWQEAAQALAQVLVTCPAPMRTIKLYRCLRDYRVKWAERHAQKGDYVSAVQVMSDTRARLASHLSAADLLELQLREGDYCWNAGRIEDAQDTYVTGQKQAMLQHAPHAQFQFAVRLGFIEAQRGELAKAVAGLKSILVLPGDDLERMVHSALEDGAKLICTPEQFYTLSELLRALAFDKMLAGSVRQALTNAHVTITNNYYRPTVFAVPQLKPQQDNPLQPVVTPIALEIDARLLPEEDPPGVQQMLEKGFPAMRDRILNDVGVRVPGVRIRSNEGNPAGGYFHSLNDTPLFLYTVYPSERFCPDAAKCQAAGLSGRVVDNPSPHGGRGMWLEEPDWHRAQDAALPLWDVFEYMTVHTERVIREHLPLFFGVQELRNALDNWLEGRAPFDDVSTEQRVSRQALLAQALPDAAAHQRLLQVLQALLHEQVPIKQFDRILAEFSMANSEAQLDVIEIAERVRMALYADLPGNTPTRTLIKLRQALEEMIAEGIRHQNGKVFLALTPERTQKFLSEFRSDVAGKPVDTFTVVVSTPEIRPFARRIVELEFPALPVLAKREVALAQEGRAQ